jgi:hypothetical protein
MDMNVLSPDQMDTLRSFEYKPIQAVHDPKLNRANDDLKPVLKQLKIENDEVQKDVSALQIMVDTLFLKPKKSDPEYKEEIKWDIYFYKKYTYQIHLLWVVIGTCVLLNIYSFLPEVFFPALAGVTIGVAFIYMTFRLWDLMLRDDTNFDEYTFYAHSGSLYRPAHNVEIDVSNCVIREDNYIHL